MVVTLPAKWCITLVCFKCGAEVIPAVNNAIQCTTVTLDGGQDELIDILNIIWIYIAAVVHQQDKQLWYLASKRVQKRIVFHTSVHVIIQAGSFISIFSATKVNRMLRQYFRSGRALKGSLGRGVPGLRCQDLQAPDLFQKRLVFHTHVYMIAEGRYFHFHIRWNKGDLNRMLRQYLRSGGSTYGNFG